MTFNKHEMEILNLLQEHSNFYTRLVREQVLKAFASKLSHLPTEAVKKGLRELEASADKDFPSLHSIRIASSRFIVIENDDENSAEVETKKHVFEKLRKQFVEKFSEEDLKTFTRAWIKHCLGPGVFKYVSDYELGLSTFEWPAILDLRDANLDPKRAIEIGKRRNQEATAC